MALVPTPSDPPAFELPANVVTENVVREANLTRLFLLSAINKTPEICHKATVGKLNCELVPIASKNPATPFPTNVDTKPVVISTLRILCPCCSTINPAVNVASKAKFDGCVSCALVPTPFAPPGNPLPIKDETKPIDDIKRMRLLAKSDTKMFPARSVVTPVGPENVAFVPKTLSTNEPPSFPATVVTNPEGFILRILPIKSAKNK